MATEEEKIRRSFEEVSKKVRRRFEEVSKKVRRSFQEDSKKIRRRFEAAGAALRRHLTSRIIRNVMLLWRVQHVHLLVRDRDDACTL